jgi:NAD(P)-dependent dehydrogenase (short-subunit alcohol dehydrogenase family)
MASLNGKVIAISGAAGGMGAATAAVLASRGARLSLADVDIKAVELVADNIRTKYQTKVFTSQVDVTKTQQVDQWIEATVEKCSKLTGAVNMAGILGKEFGVKSAHEVSDEEFDLVMSVNTRGLMACQRAELRVLEDGGSIVNIASVSAKVGFPKSIAYAASKSAVLGLTRVAAAESGGRKIRVNAVAP